MKQRRDLNKENDPQLVGVTGIDGVKVITVEDSESLMLLHWFLMLIRKCESMKRRLDLSKKDFDPQLVGVTGIKGVEALIIEDSDGDGIAFVIEVSINAFPFAKCGELFVMQLSRDGVRLRRETGQGQWFLMSPYDDNKLVWKRGECDGLMSEEQRRWDEFVLKPPKPAQKK
jgi:hypothetical protein